MLYSGPVSLTELNTDRVCEITLSVVCSACGGCCRYWPVLLWLRAVSLLLSCALLPSPRRPTAAAATSVLEGSLDDQAVAILAQAKLRILAISCA